MATVKIQHRRGSYTDFDPSKLDSAEIAVTLSNDPNASDGKAIYVGTGSGNIKQLATMEDMESAVETALGDAVERAEEAAEQAEASGFSNVAKQALLTCFRHVAWIDEHGQDYYDALERVLYVEVSSISAVFTQGSAVIHEDDSLNTLKQYLVVTATYSDSTSATVSDYTLSGTLSVGTSTITVTYAEKTTTFTVTVSDYEWGSDYTWLYRADTDGLLSNNENVSATVGINGTLGTETVSNGILNVSVDYTGSNYGNIYKLIPLTCSNGILRAKVRFNSLAKSTSPSGLRLQVSNGTNGAQLFAYRNAVTNTYRLATHEGGDQSLVVDNIELNRWYILSVELQGSKQVIKVDDTTYTINTLSSYANTETRVIVQQPGALSGYSDIGDVDVDIAWVAYKDNDT